MNLQQAVRSVLGQYAGFSGRARRSEYWYWTLAVFLVSLALSILGAAATAFTYLGYVFSLAVLIPGLAVLWRRLHDTGRSGV